MVESWWNRGRIVRGRIVRGGAEIVSLFFRVFVLFSMVKEIEASIIARSRCGSLGKIKRGGAEIKFLCFSVFVSNFP